MKRIISAVLALSLLGGSAAVAAPYDHSNRGSNGGYSHQYRSDKYRDHRNNNGDAIIGGLAFLTLAAILASQHHEHYRDASYDRGQYRGDSGYNRDGYAGYDNNGRY